MSTEQEYDNGDKHVLAFETGRRYCIRNKKLRALNIYLKPEDAISVMNRRYGTPYAYGDELVECFVSTQHGSLNIYNCKPVKWILTKEDSNVDR